MPNRGLSTRSKKALNEMIGESAGTEIAELITQMATEIETLRQKAIVHVPAPVETSQVGNVSTHQNA